MASPDSATITRSRPLFVIATALVVVTTAGVNAAWSRFGASPTLIGTWLLTIAPFGVWIVVTAGGLTAVGIAGALRGTRFAATLSVISFLLLAYLLGAGAGEWLRQALELPSARPLEQVADAVPWVLHRFFFLLAALPVLLVYLKVRGRGTRHPVLHWGSWRPGDGSNWWRRMGLWAGLVILPFFLVFHAQSDFGVVTSGALLVFLAPITLMALFNAFSEELIFRGLLLPALSDRVGERQGLWLQGILFGLLHFGSSPVPLAAVAVFVIAMLLGLLFGRSVQQTGGIGWALIAHALADFTFFSALYIAQ